MRWPGSMTVVEVAPRDGLQSFPRRVETDTKVRIIDRLSDAGLRVIEVGSFAHPRAVPNLADADDVFARIRRRPGVTYRALVPNARGAERAVAANAGEILGLMVASPTYLHKNQNMSPEEAIDQGIRAFRIADAAGVPFVMAISMAFWCPYEGVIAREAVLALLRRFRTSGIRRFYLAGSVGMEDPRHVNELFVQAHQAIDDIEVGFHVHNLGGMATANIVAAMDAGVDWLEGAVCGIGGGIAMPAALGAVGNYPTEDLVSMLELMGVKTGLSVADISAAARDVATMLGIQGQSHQCHGITREKLQTTPESTY